MSAGVTHFTGAFYQSRLIFFSLFRGVQGTEEARGSTSRKRSRTAEMHNLAERVFIFPLEFQQWTLCFISFKTYFCL